MLVTLDCMGCEKCLDICPVGAVSVGILSTYATIDKDVCIECGECKRACPVEAIIED